MWRALLRSSEGRDPAGEHSSLKYSYVSAKLTTDWIFNGLKPWSKRMAKSWRILFQQVELFEICVCLDPDRPWYLLHSWGICSSRTPWPPRWDQKRTEWITCHSHPQIGLYRGCERPVLSRWASLSRIARAIARIFWYRKLRFPMMWFLSHIYSCLYREFLNRQRLG